MARGVAVGPLQDPARSQYRAGVFESAEYREAVRDLCLRGLWPEAVLAGNQVWERNRLAELLAPGRRGRGDEDRSKLVHGASRSALRAMRQSPRAHILRGADT